jgi:hypothetical protein
LITTNLIFSSSAQSDQWLDIELKESKTLVSLKEIFDSYGLNWTVRKLSKRLQVLCSDEQDPVVLLQEIKQLLADHSLRESINKHCTIQANTLVVDILSHVLKNKK